jgi:mRNA (guanine-N7-)-methyltransferase
MENDDDIDRVKRFYDSKADEAHADSAKARQLSPIIALRQFNNWVKACLIHEYTPFPGAHVLDLAGGKGGDLQKWWNSCVRSMTLVDFSPKSVDEAKRRFEHLKKVEGLRFEADFVVGDCRRLDQLPLKRSQFHTISCQFALHYLFASEEDAQATINGIGARLVQGGCFIGTIPSARRLKDRREGAGGNEFGNAHYKVTFKSPECYTFWLEDAVDSQDEYLVPPAMLVQLANKAGMRLITMQSFDTFRSKHGLKFTRMHPKELSPELDEIFMLYDVFVFQKR